MTLMRMTGTRPGWTPGGGGEFTYISSTSNRVCSVSTVTQMLASSAGIMAEIEPRRQVLSPTLNKLRHYPAVTPSSTVPPAWRRSASTARGEKWGLTQTGWWETWQDVGGAYRCCVSLLCLWVIWPVLQSQALPAFPLIPCEFEWKTKWRPGNLFFVGCLEAGCDVLLPPAGLSYTSLVCDAFKVYAQTPNSAPTQLWKNLWRLTETSYNTTKSLTFDKVVFIKKL